MIHTAQTVIGGTVIALIGYVATAPLFTAPPPIEVHSLTYDHATQGVIQDRTVSFDGDYFYAHWVAQFIDARTGKVICKGEGDWPYKTGKVSYNIPYRDWVGDPACILPTNTPLKPVAAWYWGTDQVSHEGEIFTIEETDQ